MREKAIYIEQREHFVAFTCERCQRRFDQSEPFELQEFKTIDGTGGYGSWLGDGNHWHVDLCERCFAEVMKPWLYFTDDEGNRLPESESSAP